MWLLRKLYGGLLCYQEHGMRYTLHRIKEKIYNKLEKNNYKQYHT